MANCVAHFHHEGRVVVYGWLLLLKVNPIILLEKHNHPKTITWNNFQHAQQYWQNKRRHCFSHAHTQIYGPIEAYMVRSGPEKATHGASEWKLRRHLRSHGCWSGGGRLDVETGRAESTLQLIRTQISECLNVWPTINTKKTNKAGQYYSAFTCIYTQIRKTIHDKL